MSDITSVSSATASLISVAPVNATGTAVAATLANTPAPAPSSALSTAQGARNAAALAEAQGVVVSLSGQTSTNSASDLYTYLNQLGAQLAAPAPAAASTSSGASSSTSTTGGSASSTTSASTGTGTQPPNSNGVIDLNSEWAGVIQANPSMSLQAVQVESDQVLLSKVL